MKILSNKHCIIGEGPIWNKFNNKLYQVNGYADEILEIDIKTGEVTTRKLPFGVVAMGFSKKGEMLISCADGAFKLNDDNTRTPLYDTEKYKIEFGNDAKVGPDGRFYIGTQSSKRFGTGDEINGKLYSIDKNGEVKILLDGLILSNGFDWSIDEKRFYHTDSATGIIKEYDFDKEKGEISFTGREIRVKGVDGFTIDQNDFLYVACWKQSHIAVVDTADMQIKEYISVPAKIPASCCFAGENMDKLVIVTASRGADLSIDTNSGYTFICETKTKGRMPYLFG
ncbi:MAG: SMP-30/gluconolactonase/LRE family protein [Oscillospiraceae bacterium]|nr:SMP-30/gluconolactonase/LRE family protein [Oscillospiraceae bacterium]